MAIKFSAKDQQKQAAAAGKSAPATAAVARPVAPSAARDDVGAAPADLFKSAVETKPRKGKKK